MTQNKRLFIYEKENVAIETYIPIPCNTMLINEITQTIIIKNSLPLYTDKGKFICLNPVN